MKGSAIGTAGIFAATALLVEAALAVRAFVDPQVPSGLTLIVFLLTLPWLAVPIVVAAAWGLAVAWLFKSISNNWIWAAAAAVLGGVLSAAVALVVVPAEIGLAAAGGAAFSLAASLASWKVRPRSA